MTSVPTYLIEENHLFREGIKSFLLETRFTIMAEYPCIGAIDTGSVFVPPQLVIIGVEKIVAANYTFCERIDYVKTIFPNAYIVVMLSMDEASKITDMALCNIDGYILKNISADAFLNYLNLIMMDEKVLPVQIAQFLTKDKDEHRLNGHPLSERETSIIQYLTLGYSNKLIAYHLCVTEATVKVHLKTIQRKLDMHNRTQVALWAVNNGFKTVEMPLNKSENENNAPQVFIELASS